MTNFASKDLTAGQLNSLVKKAGGHEQVLRILSGELKIQLLSTTSDPGVVIPAETEQFLSVEADLSFEERVTRGQYGWRNSDLTEKRFPVTAEQVGDWEWKLFHFDRDISSEEAIWLMKEDGFEPAQIGHILAFGEKYPEEQRKFPIIGLDSVAEVGLDRNVPALWNDAGLRELILFWFDGDWVRDYRFLGVRRRDLDFLSVPALESFDECLQNTGVTLYGLPIRKVSISIKKEEYGDWEWKLFHFDHKISSEEAIRLMEAAGFEPASAGHIAAFGRKYVYHLSDYLPLLALGTIVVFQTENYVVMLNKTPGYHVTLASVNHEWSQDVNFLGVRRMGGGETVAIPILPTADLPVNAASVKQ